MEKPGLYRLAFLDLCSDSPSTGSVSGVSGDPTFLDPLLRPAFVVVIIVLAATVLATAVAVSDIVHQAHTSAKKRSVKHTPGQSDIRNQTCGGVGRATRCAILVEACRLGSVVHCSVQKRPKWPTIIRRFA